MELKRYTEAEVYYKDLLMRNPENTIYYAKLQEAQQLITANEKLKMFSEFQELFPRALAPRRLPLTFATGELRRDLSGMHFFVGGGLIKISVRELR